MGQSTRQITYASVRDTTGAKTIFSNATTFGELKSSDSDLNIAAHGMKAWIKSIEGSEAPGYALESDRATLPTGNFELAFLNNKNDSGNVSTIDSVIEEFLAKAVAEEDRLDTIGSAPF